MISLPNRIRLLAHGGAMVLVLGRLASAQAPAASEAVQRELQVVQDQLARATLEFEGSQQSRSIVLFDEVIARLENVQRPGPLPPRGRDLLAEAYERRGRAYFNIGLQEKASENFRLLIQLKPDHVISREKVSPKIVDLFNSVKKVLVGYVAVSSKPAGARVTLVGGGETKDLGLTDFFPQEVLAGEYTVEIAKEGFRTEAKTLNIAPRATETVQVDLVRTLATQPLEFRRKCYETVRRTLETARAEDYEVEPGRLDDSLASLRLTSDPPGAKIYLNGEAKGVTPAELEGICSGRVRVEVKHQAGKFIKDLALAKDEAGSRDCPIAVLPEERLQHTAMLHLLAAANTMAEVGEVTFVEGASYARFIAKVDQRATSYRPWSGLITVDSLLVEGVPVLRVVPGSPAAQAGIQVGEVLNAVDGKPIAKTAELLALIEQKRPKDKVALQLKGAQGSRAVELTLGQTAQEIPLFDPNLLYNKVMMDLRLVTEGYPGTEQAAFAWLNLALSAMHFQDFAAAHDYLVKARNELPQRPGISQGTALYYLGVALERLSYKPQAIEAFRAATGFKESTLIHNDAPAAAPLARPR